MVAILGGFDADSSNSIDFNPINSLTLPLNVHNEKRALRLLSYQMKEILDSYPTTLKQDLYKLKSAIPFSNEYHALIMVIY